LSFAPLFEQAGVSGAATTGLAAAMGGIVLGGVLGAPLATILIKRFHLKSVPSEVALEKAEDERPLPSAQLAPDLLYHTACLLIIGAAGWYLSQLFTAIGVMLPFYIGAMLLAMIVRNIEDATGILGLRSSWIDAVGSSCLTFFIAVSMMTLQFWTIAAVAGPLIVCLMAQVVLVMTFAATITFWVGGKNYESAVTSGGMVGFMLGTTANALATMKSIAERYGPAPQSFLVVPLVGACFIDFVNALVISVALNLFR
jgi:ESS family glutamate:Na+ symporter